MNRMKNGIGIALLTGMVLLAITGFTVITVYAHGTRGGGGAHHAGGGGGGGETFTTVHISTSTMPQASTRVQMGPDTITATTIRANTIMNADPSRQRWHPRMEILKTRNARTTKASGNRARGIDTADKYSQVVIPACLPLCMKGAGHKEKL